MKLIWLTQGGFLFETAGFRLAVDPYISNFVEKKHKMRRISKAPFLAKELKPDHIYCTHDHIDHVDPEGLPEILSFSNSCVVSGPDSVIRKYIELGIGNEKLVRTKLNVPFEAGPFKLIPIESFHSDTEATGLIIKAEGKTIYLSGDTEFKDELPENIIKEAGGKIDLAIVCINGKWGNMNDRQAFDLVVDISAAMAIPMHYGLFAENTANPAKFIELCKGKNINSFELEAGKIFEF